MAKRVKKQKVKITFVCTGNTCRSPMAEFIFKDYLLKNAKSDLYIVKSAGISANPSEVMAQNTRLVLAERGIKTFNRKAKVLSQKLVNCSDILICMTDSQARVLNNFNDKVTTIAQVTGGNELSDPYGQGIDVYRKVAEYLEYACAEIVAKYNCIF